MKKLLMVRLQFWTVILFLTISTNLFSQLSGTYTLGSASSDYPTFSDAVTDIKTQGLQDDVEFLVEPGTYNNVTISNIENPNAFSIKFSYDGSIGDSALIKGTLKVHNSPYIEFNNFTIIPASLQTYSCVDVDESTYFTLSNCKILNPDNNDFDDDEGLIKMSFPWEGPYFLATISYCEIFSQENTIVLFGKKGSFWFYNNTFTGHISDRYSYIKKHYNNNIFNLTDNDFAIANQGFVGNTFYYNDIFTLGIQGELLNNTFYTSVSISSGDVIENTFNQNVYMGYCNNADVTNNIFKSSFETTYSHGIKIRGNIFHDNVHLNNDNTSFGNNLVFDSVVFSHGPGQLITISRPVHY